jgi:hypothetical protein
MTLDQACELAKAIEGNSEFAVIAIGRFVMLEEISTESKKHLSWGVSVISLRDRSDRTVCHNESDWIAFAKALAPVANPTKEQPAAKPKPKYQEHQYELFSE